MKKSGNPKINSAKKITEKGKESGELKKPVKLKPLKEKEKKNWKNNLMDEDDDDFNFDDDLNINDDFDNEDDDNFDDDNY